MAAMNMERLLQQKLELVEKEKSTLQENNQRYTRILED